MPGIINGRNKNFGWSMTSAYADSSDLWEEEVNSEMTQYKVDGEWRNLTKVYMEIPIAGKDPAPYDAYYTHRGLLVNPE